MAKEDQIKLMQTIIDQQEKRIQEKDAAIADLRKLVDELQSLKANLEETLREFQRQFFGVRSEKTKAADTKQEEQDTTAEASKTVEVKSHTRQRKPKATRKELYANLPVREIVIPLTEEERHCPYCNAEMTAIGYTDVREELRITPAKVERILYKQEVSVCPECRKDGDGTIVKAITPTALFPHSPASASIVAYVMYHKIFVGTPYYRQETGMFQLGVKLPRETMANWCIQGAEKYFLPLFERMHELLIQRDLIHADETTCQVLREEGKAAEAISYMWIYLSGNDGLPPIILYDYQAGRAGKYAQQFLEGFHGMLQCDGYQGYNKVDNVMLVCCLAHCRRKFYEAIPAERRKKLKLLDINSAEEIKEPHLPKGEEIPSMIPAEVGLAYCNKLFFLEKQFRDLTPEERKGRRLETEVPVWESFYTWLEQLNPVKRSKLEKAVIYAKNHKETLRNYLQDGRCEISNNAAERRAKSYAIGRKAFLFHTSTAGAEASAVMYSIIETAKANNLNVFQYLYMVLLYMPDYKNEPTGIEKLLPWSDFIKERCSGLIDVENQTPEHHEPLPV